LSVPASDLKAWKELSRLARTILDTPLRDHINSPTRFQDFAVTAGLVTFDFSKQYIDRPTLRVLLKLAEERDWKRRAAGLLAGEQVNTTEQRPALHSALRAPANAQPAAIGDVVHSELARAKAFASRIIHGAWKGCSGRAITDIVHIGIGGSHLGPELAVTALTDYHQTPLKIHFIANVDGSAMASVLRHLNPETTLFVIVSKSFTTLETAQNAHAARSWLIERTGSIEAIKAHFIAVSSNLEATARFGIAVENTFQIWDWVGGRYSMWSAVGMPILLSLGPDGFQALLDGAYEMDEHFRNSPAERNAPLLAALFGIWNYDFLGINNHAVLAYDQRLRLLPNYLQQLETESNGKRVRHDGSPVGVHTMAILCGGEGTTGQHAYHQLLHQGTRSYTADFIVVARPDHDRADAHRWLIANCLAQSQAMAIGQQTDNPHQAVPGNHPTTTIVLDHLSPRGLGSLLAFYEHKVFCQGLIWDINSFDQWGVELGKKLADGLFAKLGKDPRDGEDASTQGLLDHFHTELNARKENR